METFLIWRRNPIVSGYGGISTLSRKATLTSRSLHEPQRISNHPVEMGPPHPAWRYGPGESAFTSSGNWNCRYTEGFLIRGREIILPGSAGTLRSPANQRSASTTGVSTPCGAVSTLGTTAFVPRLSEL